MFNRFRNRPPQEDIDTHIAPELDGNDLAADERLVEAEAAVEQAEFDPFKFVEENESSLNLSTTT